MDLVSWLRTRRSPPLPRHPVSWTLSLATFCIATLVFLRWQRGVLAPTTWDLPPYAVAQAAWLALLLLALGVLLWRERRHGHALASLPALFSAAGLALGSYAALPPSYSAIGPFVAYFSIRLAGGRSLGMLVAWFSLVALASCVAFYERRYGQFSRDALLAVAQTSPWEYGAYIREHLSRAHAGLLVSILLSVVAARRAAAMDWMLRRRIGTMIGIATLPAVLTILMSAVGQARNVRDAMADLRQDEHLLLTARQIDSRQATRDLDVVLVVGESNARWNWQLYGYPRETTPHLAEMRSDLIVFSDAISSHSHTVPSLMEIFYRPLVGPGAAVSGNVSLLTLLKSAGVSTEWISAQLRHGPYATPISRLAESASHVYFATQDDSAGSAVRNRDELAVMNAKQRLASTDSSAPRLFVVHMQAAHYPYCEELPLADRTPVRGIPLGKRFFGDAADRSEELECYDQAVRFTDRLIADLVSTVKLRKRPTLFLFTPDHGEAPAEGTGHQSDAHSAKHIEIPSLAYLNPAASELMLEFKANLSRNHDRPFMNSWMFELITSAFGVPHADLEARGPSIGLQPYAPPSRVAFARTRPVYYDEEIAADFKDVLSKARIAITHRTKTRPLVFAHRTDTIGKALDAKSAFDGAEIDVTWNEEGYAEVLHPPKRSISLRLDQQLTMFGSGRRMHYWLDIKNGLTQPTFWESFNALDKRFDIKGRTLIELSSPYDPSLTRQAAAQGWRIGLPIRAYMQQCNIGLDSRVCEHEANVLLQAAQESGTTVLTFDARDMSLVNAYLPPGRIGSLRLAAWDNRTAIHSLAFPRWLDTLSNIDMLAIRFDSQFGY